MGNEGEIHGLKQLTLQTWVNVQDHTYMLHGYGLVMLPILIIDREFLASA